MSLLALLEGRTPALEGRTYNLRTKLSQKYLFLALGMHLYPLYPLATHKDTTLQEDNRAERHAYKNLRRQIYIGHHVHSYKCFVCG